MSTNDEPAQPQSQPTRHSPVPPAQPSQATTTQATDSASTLSDIKAEENDAKASTSPSAEAPQLSTEADQTKVPEAEVDADADAMAIDSKPSTSKAAATEDPAAPAAIVEPRIPAKKDETLREFLNKMDDYSPIIPDAVTNYYLTLAGLPPPPQTSPHLARLIALAAQKFVSDLAADAYQYARIRASNTSSNNPLTGLGGAPAVPGAPGAAAGGAAGGVGGPGGAGGKAAEKSANLGAPRAGFGGGGQGGGQGRTVLTMEDLGMAVSEYGVNVKRGEFYR